VQTAITLLGFMPAMLFGHASIEGDPWVSPRGSIFTAMFLHGDFWHLASNMLYLWIFGDTVEDRVGRLRFVAFYLICGAIAALSQALPDMRSTVPMIGASGAVSGVLGAYVVLYPRARVLVAAPFVLLRVPALIVLGLWFVGQVMSSFVAETGAGGVAFLAHVGGFIGGAILIRWFLRERRRARA
jgi:membrane associated rhomboid family serine protease